MTRAFAVGLVLLVLAFMVVAGSRLTKPGGGHVAKAEFINVRGLVEGSDVRYQGAEAGRIERLRLRDDGRVTVTFRLDEGVPAPLSDATAVIRPVDLFGDVYLSYQPGDARTPLGDEIPVRQTANVSRVEDVLNVFRRPVAQGLQSLLTAGGMALERRGKDLNAAILATRPAFSEAARVADELSADNAALKDLVEHAERASGALAARRRSLQRALGGLAATTRAVAAHRPALARTLDGLPTTLNDLRTVAEGLGRAARSNVPLSDQLAAAAAPLATTTARLPRFLATLRAAAAKVTPMLAETRTLLGSGERSLSRLQTGLHELQGAAPAISGLTDVVRRAAPALATGLFVHVAGQASEPGRQPFDPSTDSRRRYWRGAAVMSCETFGLKVEPSCLTAALTRMVPALRRAPSAGQPVRERRPQPTDAVSPVTRPAPASPISAPAQKLKPLTDVVDGVSEPLRSTAPQVQSLLDFLLKP